MTPSAEGRFALGRWGTRFIDRGVEQAYRAWALDAAVPFNRVALYFIIIAGVCGASITLTIGAKGALVSMVANFPASLLGLAALVSTFGKRHLPKMPGLVAGATCLGGLGIVFYVDWAVLHDSTRVSMQALFGWVLFLDFFGFALLRLPPVYAIAAVGPFVTAATVLFLAHAREAGVIPASVLDVFLFPVSFVAGLAINVVNDVNARRLYRQERIIEAQREIIERELGHQVAERSRELGELLASRDASTAPLELSAGARFDARYTIVRALGSGGMGAVYEVERLTDGQSLALKVITTAVTKAHALRFTREAEIGARVRHRHLVPIVDVGIAQNGAPFLVMDLVRGPSLEEQRERFGDSKWAMPILRQIAGGLAALHAAGVVHRDLKPGNVLLAGDLAAPHVRISDFGISRFDDFTDPLAATADTRKHTDLTGTGVMLGTPLYMAPEMARSGRPADKAVDVFAFGILAYEILTKRSPFAMPPVISAMAGLPLAAPEPSPDLPDVVLACLSVEGAARPHIDEVVRRLR